MSTKKSLKRDKRGGRRENAGRKSIWKNQDTMTIRVPKAIVFQVIELAHKIDVGEKIELDTESKSAPDDVTIPSKSNQDEIIIESKKESEELKSDCVTKSTLSYSQAIEIAKKILKSKKSARISLAEIISKIYEQPLSPDNLKS